MSVVLLVDDSPSDRALFRTILKRGGFEVQEAAYGREVFEKVDAVRPMVVVLDVNLPDMDGHTICRTLRSRPSTAGLPVLMLTIRDDDRDVLAGLDAGADDYVAKDAAAEVILARVRRLERFHQMATLAVLNAQLVQLGRLLAGIVHEIRNPLSVIRANAEMMRMSLGPEHESSTWTEPILRNAQVLQKRLEHLMGAVRSGPPVLKQVELPPLVREAVDLFLRGLDPRFAPLRIDTRFPENLPPVKADGARIFQVLMNLLGNAHEALQSQASKGRVEVVAEWDDQSEGGPWVKLSIADNGPGIPETVLSRVFEPFFTTKSEGSGYGLYLAGQILKEHSGRLTASNRPEGGANFTLWFPACHAEANGTAPERAG